MMPLTPFVVLPSILLLRFSRDKDTATLSIGGR
jgi:hypothetical protein